MHNAKAVGLGILIFLLLGTFPFWWGWLQESSSEPPEIALPEGGTKCVESREYMRALHMDLLNDWRDTVVRKGERVYVSSSGERFRMSITGTCLECHKSNDEFCNRCHTYVGVSTTCFDCHVETFVPPGKDDRTLVVQETEGTTKGSEGLRPVEVQRSR